MTSSFDKTRALEDAGIPAAQVPALVEKAQSLRDHFTSLGISKMEDMEHLISILFDLKPDSKKHEVAPLPEKLEAFITISERPTLQELKRTSKLSLHDWESSNFQDEALRTSFTNIASQLEESLSIEVMKMKDDKGLRYQLLDVLVASYDCFNGVYGALWANVQMTDGKGIQRYMAMQARFRECIHASEAAGHTPKQGSEDLIDLYLSYASTVGIFDNKMEEIASKTGAMWSLAPAKQVFRILEKKLLRRGAQGVIKVCDAGRGMFEAETMDDVCNVREALLELSDTDANFWLVRIKERFVHASSGGWRDDLDNFKVINDRGDFHTFEVQISQGKMLTARKTLDGHAVFNKCRNATELLDSCFGDSAPPLALAVGKAGDEMVVWAKDNGWFLEDDIRDWGGVHSDVDGNIDGFELTGMEAGLASKFLKALSQYCAPVVKYLAITKIKSIERRKNSTIFCR